MHSILIGDVGSTKAEWALITEDHQKVFTTEGYNPVLHHSLQLRTMLAQLAQHTNNEIQQISYYGTGVIGDEIQNTLKQAFLSSYQQASIIFESDMLAAARSLCNNKEAVVCILGTGSNSCFFDGQKIVRQIPSLGFPLGDEGSGADIGRALVRAYYYGTMPSSVKGAFASALPEDRLTFLRSYHVHPAPNRFLAELIPIAAPYLDTSFMKELLGDCFRTFARFHIKPYLADAPVHFTGGVAYVFADILRHVLSEEQLNAGSIVKSPLNGLIQFHKKHTEHIQ